MALDNVLKIYDEQGNPVNYDILASDVKFNDGKDLPTKLDELEQEIGEGGYTPPQGGIPATDLAPAVQTSLGKADTAYQKPTSGIPATDLADGVIPDTSNLATKTELADKVDKVTGYGLSKNDYTDADKAAVGTIGSKANAADVYTKAQTDAAIQEAVEDIEAGETVVVNSDGANIVDEHDNNSVLLAPSARQMKLMYNNIMLLYNALANIAFTNGKPTLDWIGSKTKYTLSYGTLTGCTADVEAGQVNEGGLRIKLTPTSSSYAFTSVLVNGESVTPVATGDADGSVYVDVIVNQDITLTATAVSGYGVSLASGSNCSLSPASVTPNSTYNGVLSPNPHYTLPSSISATMGGSPITFDGTNNSYNSSTGAIKISNVTGAVVITAVAQAENSIQVTLNGTNVVFKHGDDTLTNPIIIYDSDKPYVISIKPTTGNAIGSAPTTTGVNSPVSDGEGGYTLTVDSNEASDFAITAAASAAHNVTVNVKRITGLTEYAGNAGVSPDMTITDDATTGTSVSNAAPVQDGEQFNGTVNPGTGFGVFGVKVMMGSDDVTQYYNPLTRAISIASVTDDVTITVTVREAVNGMFNGVSLHARKGSGNSGWINDKAGILVKDDDFSAMADFVELPASATKVRWIYGGVVVTGSDLSGDLPSWQRTMMFYKDCQIAFGYLSIYQANQTQRDGDNPIKDFTIDPGGNTKSAIKYIRASFKTEFLSGAKIQYTTDGTNYSDLWLGSEHVSQSNEE